MSEPTRSWTDQEMQGDDVSKKDIANFLQENAGLQFQMDNRLKMSIKNVTKNKTKDQLIALYNEMFESKSFKKEGEDEEYAAQKVEKVVQQTEKLSVKDKTAVAEPPKYTKRVLQKGSGKNKAVKGDTVCVHYTGTLDNGTMFDSTLPQGKKLNEKSRHKAQPLKFKVGLGKVIRGWDEALLTMCVGEKAEVKIESAWAYGKKEVEGPFGKIPPHSNLNFEMELVNIE